MTRVKRGKIATKKRRKILKLAKGYQFGRKSKEKLAREALLHAFDHAFADRKRKKREFRRLWQTKIKAGVNKLGLSYNRFIHLLKKNSIKLNRKTLAYLAENEFDVFKSIVEFVKKEK